MHVEAIKFVCNPVPSKHCQSRHQISPHYMSTCIIRMKNWCTYTSGSTTITWQFLIHQSSYSVFKTWILNNIYSLNHHCSFIIMGVFISGKLTETHAELKHPPVVHLGEEYLNALLHLSTRYFRILCFHSYYSYCFSRRSLFQQDNDLKHISS